VLLGQCRIGREREKGVRRMRKALNMKLQQLWLWEALWKGIFILIVEQHIGSICIISMDRERKEWREDTVVYLLC
jgi:hypothetical protein